MSETKKFTAMNDFILVKKLDEDIQIEDGIIIPEAIKKNVQRGVVISSSKEDINTNDIVLYQTNTEEITFNVEKESEVTAINVKYIIVKFNS